MFLLQGMFRPQEMFLLQGMFRPQEMFRPQAHLMSAQYLEMKRLPGRLMEYLILRDCRDFRLVRNLKPEHRLD
jgi:hypothetical protein